MATPSQTQEAPTGPGMRSRYRAVSKHAFSDVQQVALAGQLVMSYAVAYSNRPAVMLVKKVHAPMSSAKLD